ncbi:MAG TPA: nucleotidyltransferase domain-containing protein, partial [Desulfobacteraceae bacterium]|nr:nucleotidyltransferase domain-containing protein [Desulfobacteraceae bacterium]
MQLSHAEKETIKKELAESLSDAPEVVKVVVFGSFVSAEDPNDIDVAVFQNSDQPYLPLAMKYRKITRAIANKIALDILPLKPGARDSIMMDAIA